MLFSLANRTDNNIYYKMYLFMKKSKTIKAVNNGLDRYNTYYFN